MFKIESYKTSYPIYQLEFKAFFDEDGYYDEKDDGYKCGERNVLRVSFNHKTWSIYLPKIISTKKVKVFPSWDKETIERLGRDYYYNYITKRYGFYYSPEEYFLHISYGIDAPELISYIDQDFGWFVPWLEHKFSHYEFYDLDNKTKLYEFKDIKRFDCFREREKIIDKVPKIRFQCLDYDNETIEATVYIEKRVWTKGTGWFQWLKYFNAPLEVKSIEIKFNKEVGERKGSWKGGTIAHGFEIKENESVVDCFKRYCEKHNLTYFKYNILGETN